MSITEDPFETFDHLDYSLKVVAADGFLAAIVAPLLAVRRVLRERFAVLDRIVAWPSIRADRP